MSSWPRARCSCCSVHPAPARRRSCVNSRGWSGRTPERFDSTRRSGATSPAARLLLLDDPCASLDMPTRARLRRDVRGLLHRTGTPAILVPHDRTEALALGDAVVVVIGGRARQTGPISDVFSPPADVDVAA